LVCNLFDFFLTVQVKGTGRGSNEAVSDFQYNSGAGVLGAPGNGATLNPVPLTQGDYFLGFQVHQLLPLSAAPMTSMVSGGPWPQTGGQLVIDSSPA
jgi:hypothetical protein